MAGKWYEAQIGPLPAYAWIGALLGAVAVVIYTKKKQTAAATVAAPAAASGATVNSATSAIDPATGVPYASETGASGGAIGTGGVVALPQGAAFGQYPITQLGPTPQFQTNSEWESYAAQVLTAQGYDAALSGQALSIYLDGGTPTAQEQSLIEIALRAVGQPPEPPPVLGSTTPAPWQAPTGQTQSGGGLLPGSGASDTVVDRAGNTYQYSPNWSANYAALAQGQTLYYEVTPGVFNPFTISDYQTVGTGGPGGAAGFSAPLWIKVASAAA